MKLIVGLGNPGKKYEKTRHNLGFMIIDKFLRDVIPARRFGEASPLGGKAGIHGSPIRSGMTIEKKFKAEVFETEYSGEKIVVAKPQTYMNNSGLAVGLITSFYKIKPEDIWIIHDDIDLLLGSIKIRFGGASAGHKGVESIIKSLGTDKFWRFRIGIAGKRSEIGWKVVSGIRMKRKNIDDFVLGEFLKEEYRRVKEEIERASKAILEALKFGLEYSQQKFNKK